MNDATPLAYLDLLVGRQFVTPRGHVVECLGDDGTEIQCRYVKKRSFAEGNAVDFTHAFARRFLIQL